LFRAVPPPPPSPTVTPVLITDLTVSTGNLHAVDILGVGKLLNTDRTYTFTGVPANLNGEEYIKVAMDDKSNTSSQYLTFTLTGPADLYIAYDNRATALPAWLDTTWTLTTNTILTDHPDGPTRRLYKKSFTAGRRRYYYKL